MGFFGPLLIVRIMTSLLLHNHDYWVWFWLTLYPSSLTYHTDPRYSLCVPWIRSFIASAHFKQPTDNSRYSSFFKGILSTFIWKSATWAFLTDPPWIGKNKRNFCLVCSVCHKTNQILLRLGALAMTSIKWLLSTAVLHHYLGRVCLRCVTTSTK